MLVSANNLHEYFREALDAAMERTSLYLTENTQAYIVYLLSDFTRSENVYAGTDTGEKPTLAFLLLRAQESEPEEALKIFKHLGDSSLYLLGFFSPAIQNQAVGPDYYIGMGESAYSSAANLIRVTRENALTSATIYTELAHRFADLANLLKAISFHGENCKPDKSWTSAELLELLEQYEKTKEPQLLEILEKNGFSLDDKTPGLKYDK